MTSRRLALLAALLPLGISPAAPAQSTQLPCAIASQQSIGSNEKNLIAQYATEGLKLLNADDPAEVQRGRERLLTPLRCPDVSASFRVEYGRALENALKATINSGDAFRATNALLVAGMIASNSSIQAIDAAMQSPVESVRAAAAVALQQTLREQVTGRARLTSTVAESAITSAGRRLAAETSPTVVESMIVALRAASANDSPLVTQALKAIGEGAAGAFAKARSDDEANPIAWARAAERTTETLWRATYDSQVRQIDQAQSIAAATACAHILAYARDRAADEDLPMSDEEQQLLAKSINSAEAALILIHSGVAGGAPVTKTLADAFERGPDAFAREADKWIGVSGRLTNAPYRLDADDLAAE